MPRIGQNPFKWMPSGEGPSRITLVTIIFIPQLTGYWKEGLDVLKLCLQSLWQNTKQNFDLMIFDNGSCDAVRRFLLEENQVGRLPFLIFSDYNLRKLGSLNFLLSCAPGEIVSYFDSDVYFRPGWLDATLAVMDAFPEAGQVSALPTADKTNAFCSSTYQGIDAVSSIVVERGGNLIPEKFIHAHYSSIGKTKETYLQGSNKRMDTKIIRNAVSAFVSAQDFQFTTRREVLEKILPLELTSSDEYYDPVYSPVFESRINQAGYWRLSTEDYLIHHIGNCMPLENDETRWVYDVNELGLYMKKNNTYQLHTSKRNGFVKWLFQNRFFRRFVKKVHSISYSILYEKI